MLGSYIYSLNNLWLRIEQLNTELPPLLISAVEESINNLKFIPLPFTKVIPEFKRLTVNKRLPSHQNHRMSQTKWLNPRDPNSVSTYGRLNLKKQSVFYGTLTIPTAINELKPDIGDIVTVSKWKLNTPQTELTVYPTFWNRAKDIEYFNLRSQYERFLLRYPHGIRDIINAQQEFIANCFSKKIKYNSHYIFSASIANLIFNKELNGIIEAIAYPSVQDPARLTNIAFKPESVLSKYHLYSVTEYLIRTNLVDLKAIDRSGYSKTFENGRILW